ncbi:hypothetical protein RchiOBHm_Chr5g0006361 [Rosa chinensis]|uniref:Transmembrane protein n=1 Tax=Rosa chinensis TaxID=74649 RepID=A0A2P6Q3M7_ROSCH|nr:hypothetical protein RchiOBHm_Chr5g0006361 [Rosa chinensis]
MFLVWIMEIVAAVCEVRNGSDLSSCRVWWSCCRNMARFGSAAGILLIWAVSYLVGSWWRIWVGAMGSDLGWIGHTLAGLWFARGGASWRDRMAEGGWSGESGVAGLGWWLWFFLFLGWRHELGLGPSFWAQPRHFMFLVLLMLVG